MRIMRKEKVEMLMAAVKDYMAEAHGILKDDATCEHDVNICWCGYNRAYDALNRKLDEIEGALRK